MGVQTAISALTTQPVFWLKIDTTSAPTNAGTASVGSISSNGTWSFGNTTSPTVDSGYGAISTTTGYLAPSTLGTMQYTANHTLGFFFKAAQPPTSTSLLFNINAGTNNRSNSTAVNNIATDGTMSYACRSGGIVPSPLAKTNASVCDGNWHFIVFVRSGFNFYCYVDGVLQTQTGFVNDNGSSNPSISTTFQIAQPAFRTGQTTYYDEFFYAQYALTSTEIQSIWNASPFGVTSTNGGYTAQASTASSLAVDPVITTDKSASYTAELMEATFVHFPEPTISTNRTVDVGTEALFASIEIVEPAFSLTNNVEFATTPATVNLSVFVDPDIEAIGNVDFAAEAMTVSSDFSSTTIVTIDEDILAAPSYVDIVFALVEPTITADRNASVSATPLTASADGSGHSRYIRTYTVEVTGDRGYYYPFQNYPADNTTLRLANPNNSGNPLSDADTVGMVLAALPTRLAGTMTNNILSAKLNVTIATLNTSGNSGSWSPEETSFINVYRNDSLWTEASGSSPSFSSTGSIQTSYYATAVQLPIPLELKSMVVNWLNGTYTNYGVTLINPTNHTEADFTIYSSEAAESTYRPQLVITADIGMDDATIGATPMTTTASVVLVDPNLILGTGHIFDAFAATASTLFVDPVTSAGVGGGFTAGHLEAFGTINEVTVDTQRSYNFTQSDGLAATAEMAHPTVFAEGLDITIDVSVMGTASATIVPGWLVIPEGVTVDVMTASAGDIPQPTVEGFFTEQVFAEPMLMSFAFLSPDEAVNEQSDPYYQYILATSPQNTFEWFRLDEIEGNTVVSKSNELGLNTTQPDGTYINNPVFGFLGPRQRKVVKFTGQQYITIPQPYGASGTTGNIDWLGAAASSATELTIKTLEPSGTLIHGFDANTLAGAGNPTGWTVDLFEGKLRYRKWTSFRGTYLVEYQIIGNKAMNDGEWHHIVIQIGNQFNNKDIEFYIDGKLDIARFDATDTPIMAHPDYLFGTGQGTALFAYTGPNASYVQGNLEQTPYFAGQAMEYIFRPDTTLTEYQIEQLYYRALDITVNPFETTTVTATFPEPFISGNKPRALMLSFYPYGDYRDSITLNAKFDEYSSGGQRYINGGFDPNVYDVWEYYVNRVSASPQLTSISDTPETNGVHRDPVTDDVVLLDPRTIKNIDKFDIIQINGYPVDSNDISDLFVGYNLDKGYQFNLKALETFVEQVREIVDNYGTSLLVTNPRLAVDLGIVDDVEPVEQYFEERYDSSQSSQNQGLYDYRSAVVDPMTNSTGAGTAVSPTPYGYFDTHRNNRLRIIATQDGLTNLTGGWTLEDAVTFIPRDPLSIERYSYKYKDTRETGLVIGDTTLIAGLQTSKNQLGGGSGDTYGVFPAREKFLAFPPGSVKAGTPLAALANTYWDGTQERVNPYANYISAIVVNPGDSVKGTAIGGKIYVDITNRQDGRYATQATFQTLNGDAENPVIPGISSDEGTPYEQQWQYSTGRLSFTGEFVSPTGGGATTPGSFGSTGKGVKQVQNSSTGETYFVESYSLQLFSIVVDEKYPTVGVWAPSLLERGMMWLRTKVAVSENDATIRPSAMIAEVIMKNATTYINKDITTIASSMISNADIIEPLEVTAVDANIITLPLTATATITGYSRNISAGAMTANVVWNTNSVTFAGGEQVVVTLHEAISIDLYIKEEAY